MKIDNDLYNLIWLLVISCKYSASRHMLTYNVNVITNG
jgi:hypothetical protein